MDGEVTANKYGISSWVDENVLKLAELIVIQLCKHTRELLDCTLEVK